MSGPNKNRSYPYPEFIKGNRGAGWKVEEAYQLEGWVAPASKRLHVPLSGLCPMCNLRHAAAVRNHEQCHIKFTFDRKGRMPRLPKGLREIYFQVAEDIRMDICIRTSGVDQPPVLCEYEAGKWVALMRDWDDKQRVTWMCACGVPDYEVSEAWMREACKQEPRVLTPEQILSIRERAHDTMTRLNRNRRYQKLDIETGQMETVYLSFPTLSDTWTTAWWLQNLLESLGVEEPIVLDNASEKGETDPVDPDDPDEYDPTQDQPLAEEEADEDGDPATENPNQFDGTNVWGSMDIEEVPLTTSIPGRLIQRWASTDEGVHMRSPHRWMTDKKIFGVRRRVAGGSVLFDCSGSMSPRREELFDLLCACPGALIACYNGDGHHGWLRIVARNGRICDTAEIKPPGGLNTVDGPALAWLGKQIGPRVWVSDGWVNGGGSGTSDNLYFDRDMLVARHQIRWVNPQIVGRSEMVKSAAAALQRL